MLDIVWYPSKNYADREGKAISAMVLHNTAGSYQGSLQRLCDTKAKSRVSAHYLVTRVGQVFHLVDDRMCAWHSGNRDMNQRSIGIEFEAREEAKGLTTSQEETGVSLIRWLMPRYGISVANIFPHREVLGVNTFCPGLIWPTAEDFKNWKERNLL